MLKSLCRLATYINESKNKLLMIKILLNVTNVFMFSMMQSLEKKLLKSIIMIYCQNTLKFKRF